MRTNVARVLETELNDAARRGDDEGAAASASADLEPRADGGVADGGHQRDGIGRTAGRLLICVLSPTWALAHRLKRRRAGPARTRLIVLLNRSYLAVAILAAAATLARSRNVLALDPDWLVCIPCAFWFAFLWSRCTEVLVAFYRDAFAKLALDPSDSDLAWWQRVRLALNSYAELVLNFALMYRLLPKPVWDGNAVPSSFTDLLFYSASTITTSGGGGFQAGHWSLQLLTAYEIICGLVLLVVCFAVYAGRAFGALTTEQPGSAINPGAESGAGTSPGTPWGT